MYMYSNIEEESVDEYCTSYKRDFSFNNKIKIWKKEQNQLQEFWSVRRKQQQQSKQKSEGWIRKV